MVAAPLVAKNKKSRRGRTPEGIQPRRLTLQQTSRHVRVVLQLVVRQFRWSIATHCVRLPTATVRGSWAKARGLSMRFWPQSADGLSESPIEVRGIWRISISASSLPLHGRPPHQPLRTTQTSLTAVSPLRRLQDRGTVIRLRLFLRAAARAAGSAGGPAPAPPPGS